MKGVKTQTSTARNRTQPEDSGLLGVQEIRLSSPRSSSCCLLRRLMSRDKRSSKAIAIAIVLSGVLFVCVVGYLVVFSGSDVPLESTDSQKTLDAVTPSPSRRIYPSLPFVTQTNSPPPPTTFQPIPQPTKAPVSIPAPIPASVPRAPTPAPITTTFYTIGDIPYSRDQSLILEEQMKQIPADAEFVVHVGDLRYAAPDLTCRRAEYEDAARLLNFSHAPVFVIKGDNDWMDCPNADDGKRYWHDTFEGFEGKHWNHNFDIRRQPNRTDNFAFVHKGTFFAGLNLIGGDRTDYWEWTYRMRDQIAWLLELITEYSEAQGDSIGRIVIFGHANPNHYHNEFFVPLRRYIRDKLDNSIPMLYLNGDKHEWSYDPVFYNQKSFLRMMVSGKGIEPPLKVTVSADGTYVDPTEAFVYDRLLDSGIPVFDATP